MTKEEALKKLADIIFNAAKGGYIPYDTDDELCAMNIAREHIDDFYTYLPSNLDEAAVQAHIRMEESGEEMSFLNTFKAGAEWMAGQGETIEGEVMKDINNNLCVTAKGFSGKEAKFGDKVVVQIRKKQWRKNNG